MTNYVDCVEVNYEDLACSWAKKIDQPFSTKAEDVRKDIELINALWFNVYPEVLESIECNPHEFAERVAVYRMANQLGE